MEKQVSGVKYFTAIIFDGGFRKYRNIHNRPPALQRFERFALRKFPGAKHINYYSGSNEREPGIFLYQKKFD